jgi:hypothetical protein
VDLIRLDLTRQQTYSAGQIVLYISLGFSKVATILLVRRLFIRDMNAWKICNVITGAVVIWTLVSAVLVSAGCSGESLSPKTPSQICSGIEARYLFVVITDAITDTVLAFVPAYLCRRLQMDVLFKLQVLAVFALRLPLILLAGLFFKTWKSSLHSNNPGIARTAALVFQQSQLCFSLIAGTIPCLKSFIQSFDTGSGVKAGFGYSTNSGRYGTRSTMHHSNTAQTENGESYQMSSLTHVEDSKSRPRNVAYGEGEVKVSKNTSAIEDSVELERRSTQESDRKSHRSTQELFIRKDVQWEIRREPARRGSDTNLPGLLRLPK